MVKQNSKPVLSKSASAQNLVIKPFMLRDMISNSESQIQVYTQADQYMPAINETDQSYLDTLQNDIDQKIMIDEDHIRRKNRERKRGSIVIKNVQQMSQREHKTQEGEKLLDS